MREGKLAGTPSISCLSAAAVLWCAVTVLCCAVVCCGVLQHYLANDQKLKRFVPLIKDSLVFPAIYDADRTLLSLPPIINGAATAVSTHSNLLSHNNCIDISQPCCCLEGNAKGLPGSRACFRAAGTM
jgi:hypothetical protein